MLVNDKWQVWITALESAGLVRVSFEQGDFSIAIRLDPEDADALSEHLRNAVVEIRDA